MDVSENLQFLLQSCYRFKQPKRVGLYEPSHVRGYLPPYSVVCANFLALKADEPKIWNLGNQWDPPDMTKYCFSMVQPKTLSFEELMKLKKEKLQAMREQPQIPVIIAPSSPRAFSLENYVKSKKQK